MSRIISCGKILSVFVIPLFFAVLWLMAIHACGAYAFATTVSVRIDDGNGGSGTSKIYDGREILLIGEIHEGTDDCYLRWYRQSGADFVLIDENSGTLALKYVPDSGNYRCAVYRAEEKLFESPVISVSILPKSITCTILPKESVYGEEEADLSNSYLLSDAIVPGDDLAIALYKEEGSAVGDYDIFGSWNHNPNYNLTFEGGTNAYTVTKREVICSVDPVSSFYGEPIAPLGYTVLSGSFVTDPGISITTTAVSGADAGTYAVQAAYADTVNYRIAFSNNNAFLYTILPRPVSIRILPARSVYGEPTVLPGYAIVSGSVLAGDSLDVRMEMPGFPADGTWPAAGSYKVDADALCSGNYLVSILNDEGFLYEVTRRPLVISIRPAETVYGDEEPDFEFDILSGTLASGESRDVLSITLGIDAIPHTDAGVYAITGRYTNANYDITFINGLYTVKKRLLNVSFKNYKELVYNGAPHHITVELYNVIYPEEVILQVEGNDNIYAGSYEIRVVGFGSGNDSGKNYRLPTSGISQKYTIARRQLGAVEFIDSDDSVYNGEQRKPKALPTGYRLGDDVSLEYSYYKEIRSGVYQTIDRVCDAGRYRIMVAGISGEHKENYFLPEERQKTFVISPAELVYITADAQSVYGERRAELTCSLAAGTIYGDDEPGVTLFIQDFAGNAGIYTIAGYVSNPNYTALFTGGTYTVIPKPVTLTYSGAENSRTYSKTVFYILIGVEGLVYGDKVRYDPASIMLTRGNDPVNFLDAEYSILLEDQAGFYTLTVAGIAGEDAGNYTLAVSPYYFTILRREITLEFKGDKHKIYDGQPLVLDVSAGNVLEEVSLDITGNGASDAGEHVLTVNAVDNPNYKLPAVHSVVYRIEKAKPVITVDAVNYVFVCGDEPHSIGYHVSPSGLTVYKGPEYMIPFINYFMEAGNYELLLATRVSGNYAASDPVYVHVVVLETCFYEGTNLAILEKGADPDAVLETGLVRNRSPLEGLFKPQKLEEKVSFIYYASVKQNGIPVPDPGRMTLTFRLPVAFQTLETIDIMYKKNGVYMQETLPVVNGSITFTSDGPGYFAIIEAKDLAARVIPDENPDLAVAIAATLAGIALILTIVLAMITKSRCNPNM